MTERKKNVLIIITKLSNGGAERNAALLADRLLVDYNVHLVVFDRTKQDYDTKAQIIDLKTPKTKCIIKKFYQTIVRINKIKKIKREYNIDCSISFLTSPNFVNVFSRINDKVIISIRNYISMYNKKIIFWLINNITCKKADKIVCVSESVKNDQINTYKVDSQKLVTIYNSCKLQDEKIVYDKKYESDIITIGRLNIQKGQWHLIKAFKLVLEEYPNSKMLILGNGKLEKKLKKLIKENNMEKNIEIKSFVNNVQDYLANSKIFVLPSIYEGLPNVVLEAMAIGLPVIATDCYGGTREILHPQLKNEKYIEAVIEGEYGILIPNMGLKYKKKITTQEKKLAEYLKKLLGSSSLREEYIQKSKERIKFFNEDMNLNLWKKII